MLDEERGYVLILTIVMICALTLSMIVISHRTIFASALSWRRVDSVRAFTLAENAAMEGYWQIQKEPNFRANGQRHLEDGWYRYTIIDLTPATTDDLNLEVIGEGFVKNIRREVQIRLSRSTISENFIISAWEETR